MPILVFFNIFIYLEKEVSLISMQERGVTPHWSLLQIPLRHHHPPDAAKAGAGRWQGGAVTSRTFITSKPFWSFNCSRVHREDAKTSLHLKSLTPMFCFVLSNWLSNLNLAWRKQILMDEILV